MDVLSARGSVSFVERAGRLLQAYELVIANPGRAAEVRIAVNWGGESHICDAVRVEPGEREARVFVPDVREPVRMSFDAGGARLAVEHRPARHWTVHLVQFAHHDLGYTNLPTSVLSEYCGFYDDILRLCDETDGFPDQARFRYNVEAGWSLLHYLEQRPAEVCERVVRRAKEGRIGVNALVGNEVTELLGPEEMIRSLYPVFDLKRRHGIPVSSAEINDIPGLSWGLATALAGAGVKYFRAGFPDWYFEGHHSFWDKELIVPGERPHAFWWEAANGARVLFWVDTQGAGGDVEPNLPELTGFLEGLDQSDYPYDVVRYQVMGGHRDNASPEVGFAHAVRDWNSRWAYPKLVVSVNSAFFADLEKQLGEVPVWRGEIPGTDYSPMSSTTAYASSLNRNAHDVLLAAERLAAVAASITPFPYPAEKLREAYNCTLLNDEHAWGLAYNLGPGHEAAIFQHCEFAYRAAALAHDVLAKSVNEIADHIARTDEGYHAVVFNPFSRQRTDVAVAPAQPISPCDIALKPRSPGLPPVGCPVSSREVVRIPMELIENGLDVVDVSTGRPVPHEVYEITSPYAPIPYASARYSRGKGRSADLYEVRFLASDVPAMGYKLYKFVPAKRTRTREPVQIGRGTIENRFYRVELDPKSGVIRTIFDKDLGRELVDQSAEHGANALLVRSSLTSQVTTSGRARISRGRCGAVSGSLLVETSAEGCPQIVQEILLYADIKRIDIGNRILKDAAPLLELFLAFPFAFERPRFRYEGPLCAPEAFVDQLPGTNTDYYAVQHWASVCDDECGVAFSSLDAPMTQFGGNWPLYISPAHNSVTPPNFDHAFPTREDARKGHVYSFLLVNNTATNFTPSQSGDLLFRYSITSFPGAGNARDFGYGASLPFVHAAVEGARQDGLAPSGSWLRIEPDNVLLLALKRAEDGRGLIVRVLETEGWRTDAEIELPFVRFSEAYETDLVEQDLRRAEKHGGAAKVTLNPWDVATIRVIVEEAGP